MAFQTLIYRFRADGSQFNSETNRMASGTEKIGIGMAKIGVGIGATIGALRAAVGLVEQWGDAQDRLNVASAQTTADARVLGEGRAEALAVRGVSGESGIGPEQFFDAAEAVRDALVNKEGEAGASARAAARGVGLDREAFIAPELSQFERGNLLLDAILKFEGTHGELLQATSELGAGDFRDFVTLAGRVEDLGPQYHPREIASVIDLSGATISDAQAGENLREEVDRNLAELLGIEHRSGQDGFFNQRNLLGWVLPDDVLERNVGEDFLSRGRSGGLRPAPHPGGRFGPDHPGGRFGQRGDEDFLSPGLRPGHVTAGGRFGQRGDVTIVVRDSTVGGIAAVQEITDGQDDGRAVTSTGRGVPSR